MKQNVDVLVIGGGVAGAVSATHLSKLGYNVLLVHQSVGLSRYSSGAVDVADSTLDDTPGIVDPFDRGNSWLKAAQEIGQKNCYHPYAQFQHYLKLLPDALSLLSELAKDVALERREDGCNHVLVTQLGTVKKSALVQKSLAFDVATVRRNAVVGIVQLSGLWGFEAKPVADMLRWIGQMQDRLSFQVIPIEMQLPSSMRWRSFLEAARMLDDEQMQAEFISSLKQGLHSSSVFPDYLLFPAMMGLKNPIDFLKKIESEIAICSYELLAMSFSVPGLRLSQALFSGLTKRKVTCINGQVQKYDLHEGNLISVVIQEIEGQQTELGVKAVILASGRNLSGGFANNDVMRDTIFNLPVWTNQGPAMDKFSLDMTQISADAPHELFRLGLACDVKQRPLNQFGELAADNLYAAGSALKGYEPAKEGSGIGVAAWLGLTAANFADEALRQK